MKTKTIVVVLSCTHWLSAFASGYKSRNDHHTEAEAKSKDFLAMIPESKITLMDYKPKLLSAYQDLLEE